MTQKQIKLDDYFLKRTEQYVHPNNFTGHSKGLYKIAVNTNGHVTSAESVTSSDILGNDYYNYFLTSSNYTPTLNSSITITCTVKNIYGDTVPNKAIQLYQNDVAIGNNATTNNNGVATWTITCSTAGIQKFSIQDTTIEIFVDTTSKPGHTHTTLDITNLPTIPTKTSDLTNDSNFLTSLPSHNHDDRYYTETEINTALNEKIEESDLLELIYPIGSIYMEKDTTSHSVCPIQTRLGGTWTRIENRFLYASENGQGVGLPGGSETVTLTAAQSGVPAHSHGMAHTHNHQHTAIGYVNTGGGGTARRIPIGYDNTSAAGTLATSFDRTASSKSDTDNNTAQDASEAHSNMPPYIIVNVWERIK